MPRLHLGAKPAIRGRQQHRASIWPDAPSATTILITSELFCFALVSGLAQPAPNERRLFLSADNYNYNTHKLTLRSSSVLEVRFKLLAGQAPISVPFPFLDERPTDLRTGLNPEPLLFPPIQDRRQTDNPYSLDAPGSGPRAQCSATLQ